MRALWMVLLLATAWSAAWSGAALAWEFQPSLRYGGEWDSGYSGNTLRLGYALGWGDIQLIPGWYYAGQPYGGEMGLSLLAHIPGWLPGDFSQGPYLALDLGAGLFRPQAVLAWAVQAGWQLSWQVPLGSRRAWLVLRAGLRYHDAPWYSRNIAPQQSLDIPLTLAVVWGR